MKKFAACMTVIFAVAVLSISAVAGEDNLMTEEMLYASEQSANWDAFSKNLVRALTSSNEGLQQSAMGLVIKHGSRVDVKDAVYEVLHVFRTHENAKVRLLALVTLSKIDHTRTNYLLKRQIAFEADPVVKRQIQHLYN